MLTILITIVVVLVTLTWWLHQIKPTSLTLKASLLRLLSLEVEMKRPEPQQIEKLPRRGKKQ